jgi:hypothetical protein
LLVATTVAFASSFQVTTVGPCGKELTKDLNASLVKKGS